MLPQPARFKVRRLVRGVSGVRSNSARHPQIFKCRKFSRASRGGRASKPRHPDSIRISRPFNCDIGQSSIIGALKEELVVAAANLNLENDLIWRHRVEPRVGPKAKVRVESMVESRAEFGILSVSKSRAKCRDE